METVSAKKTVRRLPSKPPKTKTKPLGLPPSPAAMDSPRAKPRAKPRGPRSWSSWLASTVARLFTWFAIITIIFRCPANLESCDESSPALCAPYFKAKAAVIPHVAPYYETYAEPYIELARPYYNTARDQVFLPAYGLASLYVAPRIEKTREYGQEQWEKNVQPQLDLYQEQALEWYHDAVAPHVEQAHEAIQPYIDLSKERAIDLYHESLLPAYEVVQPYVLEGYSACADYTTNTVLPAANWTWTNAYIFMDGTVWPQIRFLYRENVEPQLIRIGERLGRHKNTGSGSGSSDEDNILQNASVAASSASSAISSSVARIVSTIADMNAETAKPMSTHGAIVEGDDDDYFNDKRPISEIVAHDLQKWEARYAKAAEDGVTAIVKRVDEISNRLIRKNVKLTGQRLLDTLQDTVDAEVETLKERILVVVASSSTPEEGAEAVAAAVRQVGLAIKEKAQDVRSWRQRFTDELQTQVTRAAENNVLILDEIRDLALQKIGMKWAWMDGVTYKDWQNFHELRNRLTEWTQSVKSVVVTHPGIEEAENAAQDIEDAAMDVAQAAAKQLTSIKKVGQWKVQAGDTSESFESTHMDPESDGDEAQEYGEAAQEYEAVQESQKATQEATEATQEYKEDDEASDKPETQDEPIESSSDDGSNSDASTDYATSTDSDSDSDSEASTDYATPIDDETLQDQNPLVDEAEEAKAQTPADSELDGGSAPQDPLIEKAEEIDGQTPTDESAEDTLKAMDDEAQILLERETPPQGEEKVDAQTPAEEVAAAQDPLIQKAEEAGAQSPTDYEVVEPDQEGVPQAEQNESVADDLASEASDNILGATKIMVEPMATPKIKPAFLGVAADSVVANNAPILDDESDYLASITQMAQAAYSSAAADAASRYSMASSVVSVQMYGTPQPVHKSLLADLSSSYSAAVAAASSQLNNVVEAAAEGIRGTPITTAKAMLPTAEWAKAEVIAAQKLIEGRMWAEMQYSSVKVALGLATPTPTGQVDKAMAQAKHNYYAGLGLAQERYFNFLSAASSAFNSLTGGPTPTPTNLVGTASSVASVASESAAAVASSLSAAAEEGASAAVAAANSLAAAAGESIELAIANIEGEATEAVKLLIEGWDNAVAQISAQVYGEPTPLLWYEDIGDVTGKVAAATDAVKNAVEKDEL